MKWFRKKSKEESAPSLDEQRGEKLTEMGAQLSSLRQEKNLSLEEMVAWTRIPRRLLQAIEEGDLKELPEPIYIQGLIRQYADALGMNGAEFASSFPIGTTRVSSFKPAWTTTPMGELRPVHLYLLYIFLIICSVSGLSQFLNANRFKISENQSQENAQTEAVIQQATGNSQSQNILQPISYTKNSTSNNQQVEIGVTLKEKSWIRVVVDGKVEYEGELPEGTHRIWTAQEMLTVRTDNAGGVMVSVNKEEAKQLGEHGKEKEVTIGANTRS